MVSVVVHVSIELAPPPRSNMLWALKKAQKAQNPSLADRYSNILQRFENFINPRPRTCCRMCRMAGQRQTLTESP